MPNRSFRYVVSSLVLTGCVAETRPELVDVDPATYAAEFAEWRSDRRERLVTPPSGPVLWIGLHELAQGANPAGSDPDLPIVFPASSSPPHAGTFHRSGQDVRFEPAPGAPMTRADGTSVTEPIPVANDRADEPTQFALGALGMRVHAEAGTDRLWLRVWDEAIPSRDSFRLPETFPLDPAWRTRARFDPYPEPRVLPVTDVTSGRLEYRTPGELVFERDDVEHRLIAIASETSARFFVMMWDSTATSATYPIGRYLGVPLADDEGWTTIDFNRAYNAPCAFTAFSVCGIPPLENRLPFAVTAGEKRPDD
ncbi:MAG: DUF1684 domain-containing protein [Gemmatimonadetes bacterium]|nr:DUF1684 domain-containing protein [Gemmatimonadota bacterium]